MYQSLTTVDGATAVSSFVGSSLVQSAPDGLGLVFAPPEGGPSEIDVPERLRQWLIDLRLLRHIPLAYLVPDSALLPTESIRFFHVDVTWVDRVIDGVFSAANIGTTDAVYSYGLLASARQRVDAELEQQAADQAPAVSWIAATGMTGMLIRSELARRWPDMIVEAWTDVVADWKPPITSKPMAVLRNESISKDVYIALFAGQPKMVTIREPFAGVRFGVEPDPLSSKESPPKYKVDSRKPDGTNFLDDDDNAVPINVAWRLNAAERVINFGESGGLGTLGQAPGDPRQLAINLEQKPYLQEFKEAAGLPEHLGSKEPDGERMTFRKGRYMKLDGLKKRLEQLQKAGE